MGITIGNNQREIDMGCGGFLRLRTTISKLVDPELHALYLEIFNNDSFRYKEKGFETEKAYWDDYDERLNRLAQSKLLDPYVLDFLYRSDCSCESLSVKHCRHLWKVIRDYDDDVVYGYAGRPDRAMFKDFKRIVEECAKNRWVLQFS